MESDAWIRETSLRMLEDDEIPVAEKKPLLGLSLWWEKGIRMLEGDEIPVAESKPLLGLSLW